MTRDPRPDPFRLRVGDPVIVFHWLDLEIAAVRVVVRRAVSGQVVEEGDATLEASGWRYVATQAVPAGTELTVAVTLTDADEIQVTRTVPVTAA